MRVKLLSILSALASIAVVFAQEENATVTTTTTTTTATTTSATIDLSIIVPIINQLIPVFLVIGVISALFRAFRGIAISKIHNISTIFSRIKPYLPTIFAVMTLCVGTIVGANNVYAQDTINMDMSGLANMLVSLMISLLPLLFVLMIFKAIMSAFSDALR